MRASALKPVTRAEKEEFIRQLRTVEHSIHMVVIAFKVFQEAESEGLLRHDRLFPQGGTHEQRQAEVVTFITQRRRAWEESVKGLSEEKKRVSFFNFLERAGKDRREALRAWRRARQELGPEKGE